MAKKVIFDKKNVLVTGGAGFIGSHLCDELLKTCKVICIDNFSSGDERNIDHLLADPDFEFIRHDITEQIDLEELPELQKFKIEFQGIQEIYHLACPTSPKNFQNEKINTVLANSQGVINVLEIAKKYNAKMLHFSSSVVYGPKRNENERIKEEDIGRVDFLSERSCYDEGKRFAETIVKNYKDVFNIDARIIRVFRTYGPRMKLNDGQMIPDFISNALDGRDLEIYGDASFSSSFCYVSDVVDAAVKMMEANSIFVLNIGSDVEVGVSTVAQLIIDSLGSSSSIKYVDPHFFVTPLCIPDTAKARNELGWMPIVNMDKGIQKTIDDLRASKDLKRLGSIA